MFAQDSRRPPRRPVDAAVVDFGVLVTDEPGDLRPQTPDEPGHDRQHPGGGVPRGVGGDGEPPEFKPFGLR